MTDDSRPTDAPELQHLTDDPSAFSHSLERALDTAELAGGKQYRGEKSLHGLPTGFLDLDDLTGGLAPGTLTVIAARPAIGRTTLLTDICRHNAIANNTPAALWTMEETTDEIATRILAAEARVPRHLVRSGALHDDDWARVARRVPALWAVPLYLHAPASTTMAALAAAAAETHERHGIKMIAVDGIQDIQPPQRSDLREREVGDVVRGLKTLARTLGVPVVATSHLNRNPERRIGNIPALDDLRESGAITFAADTIILLHRDDAYDRESPRAGEADLIVAKHRQGPTANLTVGFQAHYGRFTDFAA
jgi:replicative DNA helicase